VGEGDDEEREGGEEDVAEWSVKRVRE